jgi:hypothetical protein
MWFRIQLANLDRKTPIAPKKEETEEILLVVVYVVFGTSPATWMSM